MPAEGYNYFDVRSSEIQEPCTNPLTHPPQIWRIHAPKWGIHAQKIWIHACFLGDGLFLKVPKRRRHANGANMLVKSGITFFGRVPKRRRHAPQGKKTWNFKVGILKIRSPGRGATTPRTQLVCRIQHPALTNNSWSTEKYIQTKSFTRELENSCFSPKVRFDL